MTISYSFASNIFILLNKDLIICTICFYFHEVLCTILKFSKISYDKYKVKFIKKESFSGFNYFHYQMVKLYSSFQPN